MKTSRHKSNKSAKSAFFRPERLIAVVLACLAVAIFIFLYQTIFPPLAERIPPPKPKVASVWVQRATEINAQFKRVYSAGWEGANGAIGNAYLFAATGDSSLLYFHLLDKDMRKMFNGTWVDDRAWICLAELYWWDFTGRKLDYLVADARQRYLDAKKEGRLSYHEGYWSWYNYTPGAKVNERIFTNSNMNQLVSVACRLYEATGDEQFKNDALKIWYGDKYAAGIVTKFYRGNGVWKGEEGQAAFGKQLPWEGVEYCSIGSAVFSVTKDSSILKMIVSTVRRIMDPKTGWVDPHDFYQIRMDGNGAFVHYLLDAYACCPAELSDVPGKVEKMLEHVWTNGHGKAAVTLHREYDHGIRNGWNPAGGEDGYGVNEVGTVHAQSQAVRAFGVYAYYQKKGNYSDKNKSAHR